MSLFDRSMNFIDRLFNQHALVRRVLVIWAIWLITKFALRIIDLMTVIDTATASVVATFVGILSTVLLFYINSRKLDAGGEST